MQTEIAFAAWETLFLRPDDVAELAVLFVARFVPGLARDAQRLLAAKLEADIRFLPGFDADFQFGGVVDDSVRLFVSHQYFGVDGPTESFELRRTADGALQYDWWKTSELSDAEVDGVRVHEQNRRNTARLVCLLNGEGLATRVDFTGRDTRLG